MSEYATTKEFGFGKCVHFNEEKSKDTKRKRLEDSSYQNKDDSGSEGEGETFQKDPPVVSKVISQADALSAGKFIISEVLELFQTLWPDAEAREKLKLATDLAIKDTKVIPEDKMPKTEPELLCAQADAAVDIIYYTNNLGVKHNLKLDQVYEIVHKANMSKTDSQGRWLIRKEDGKIVKSRHFQEPDLSIVFKDETKSDKEV
jgi:predicted HAD superfamily Cof-like phosphohydrolase